MRIKVSGDKAATVKEYEYGQSAAIARGVQTNRNISRRAGNLAILHPEDVFGRPGKLRIKEVGLTRGLERLRTQNPSRAHLGNNGLHLRIGGFFWRRRGRSGRRNRLARQISRIVAARPSRLR